MYCIGRREKNRLSVGQITRCRERSIAMRNFKAFFFFLINISLSLFHSHTRVLRLSFSRLAGGPGRARVDGLFSESVDAAHVYGHVGRVVAFSVPIVYRVLRAGKLNNKAFRRPPRTQ